MAKSGWSMSPAAFVGAVEDDLRLKRNQIAMEALQAVISGSPVDQGAFRMNNRVTIDSVEYGFDIAAGRGKGNEPPRGASAGVPAFDDGLEVIASATEPFQEILIQNNLPYAELLEDGHSGQASEGVYGVAFAAVVAKHGGNR